MATDSKLAPELKPTDEIRFVGSHRPALLDGDYKIEVQQVVSGTGVASATPPTASREFSVKGPRFELDPQLVHAEFPPGGSRGNFWSVLPHIILERSTMPWERTACNAIEIEPPSWLLLLCFEQTEAPKPYTKALGDLSSQVKNPASSSLRWPGVSPELGQTKGDKLQLIDVKWSVLKPMRPTSLAEFKYRSHARVVSSFRFSTPAATLKPVLKGLPLGKKPEPIKGSKLQTLDGLFGENVLSKQVTGIKHGDGHWQLTDVGNKKQYGVRDMLNGTFNLYEIDKEQAVVIANRLPKPGARNVAHLVSIENRYQKNPFDFTPNGILDGDTVTLVTLRSWSFFCLDETKTFKGLAENLNKQTSGPNKGADKFPWELQLPYEVVASTATADAATAARSAVRSGLIPLPHQFRRGERSVSWYRGPLVPRSTQRAVTGVKLPTSAADALLVYEQKWGMFDVSYAAAWELGRMLTLQNSRVALRQFNWKRSHAHALNAARHLAEYGYDLPVGEPQHDLLGDDGTLPDAVAAWLDQLTLLQHVPFNYLVPDERLLPVESLRFFDVDPTWLECLRDGSFSIGRVSSSDLAQEALAEQPKPIPPLSGVLIRSELVAGFPGLHAEGYGKVPANPATTEPVDIASSKLPLRRMERLSKNILLCLFEGSVKMLDLHLKQETLHFGLDTPATGIDESKPTKLVKNFRTPSGKPSGHTLKHGTEWIPDATTRIVKFLKLAKDPKYVSWNVSPTETLDAADFAMQMVAGVDLVRFLREPKLKPKKKTARSRDR